MRQIFRALSAVLALLAIALVSSLITMRFVIHGAEVRVPKLAGLTLPEATARLHVEGLETGIDGHFYSTSQPVGHVLTQSPAPGTLVRKSWRVRFTVSLGPQKAAIPLLEGMNQSIAGITIQRVGLQLGNVLAIPYGYAPQNTVIAQTPLAHATDVEGPKVGLLTALAVVPEEDASVMPDLTGETFTSAALAILHAGFQLAPLESPAPAPAVASDLPPIAAAPPPQSAANPPSASSGIVIAQVPVAGSRIVAGSMIHLTVQP
ncbi:MAG: PASTA domain-containing protein [Acidobacteriaceae bacterium]